MTLSLTLSSPLSLSPHRLALFPSCYEYFSLSRNTLPPPLSHTRAHTLVPLSPTPSRSPPDPHCRRPLLAAVTGLSSTPFLSTTMHPVSSHRAPRTVGQKLDFLGASDKLLGGGG